MADRTRVTSRWWAVARDVALRQGELHLSQVAAGVAFWLLIALFPAGLAVVNVAGLFVPQETVAHFVGHFVSETPGSLGETVAQQLRVVAEPSPGTLVPDAVLVVVGLWTVSTAIHHLIRGIQIAADDPGAPTLVVRTIAVAATVGVVIGLGLLAWALDASTLLGSVAGYVASGIALTVLTAVMYRIALSRSSVRALIPGALVAAAGFVLVALGLELYSEYAGNLRLIYGTVAGIVISMLGVWLGLYVMLVGAAVNARLADGDVAPGPRRKDHEAQREGG